MYNYNQEYELGRIYRQKREQQANQYELAQQTVTGQTKLKMASIYKPSLFKLGQKLEAIGNELQGRYGNDLKPSPSKR